MEGYAGWSDMGFAVGGRSSPIADRVPQKVKRAVRASRGRPLLLSVRGGRALGLPLLFQKDRDLLRGLLHPAFEPFLGPSIEAVA